MPDYDRRPGSADRGRAIRTLPDRERMTAGQEYAPRIEMVVGRDGYSGGIALIGYLITDDGRAKATPLFCHRWQLAPQSLEECVLVAYRGIAAYMMEAGIAFE